jgi:hypothetical protein
LGPPEPDDHQIGTKSYLQTTYRKIEVSSRTQAVRSGVDHGVDPDHHRIDHWRVGL